jgi:hypothetical protein
MNFAAFIFLRHFELIILRTTVLSSHGQKDKWSFAITWHPLCVVNFHINIFPSTFHRGHRLHSILSYILLITPCNILRTTCVKSTDFYLSRFRCNNYALFSKNKSSLVYIYYQNKFVNFFQIRIEYNELWIMKFNSTFLNCVSTLFTEAYSEFSYEEYECYLISCNFFTAEDCTERILSYDLIF